MKNYSTYIVRKSRRVMHNLY